MNERIKTIRIESMVDKGMALGRLDGKAVFIPFAAPGDLVEVEMLREKKRYAEARILHLLEPSKIRRDPPCPQFGTCGGCQWQHIPYDLQLEAKTKSIKSYFEVRLGIDSEDLFEPTIPSPREWGYRNKIGLKASSTGTQRELGYFAAGTHKLVPAVNCPIARPEIEKILPALSTFIKTSGASCGLEISGVDLQADGASELWANLRMEKYPSQSSIDRLCSFCKDAKFAGAFIHDKKSKTQIFGSRQKMRFPVAAHGREMLLEAAPGGFVQTNPEVNQLLIDEVMAFSQDIKGKKILDLYCGAGNFTLPMASIAGQTAAVEGNGQAARDLETNAELNSLNNIRALPLSAKRGLKILACENFKPYFVLLDPPREGAADAILPLTALKPELIVYISCSPPTLIRDLKAFQKNGYGLKKVKLADMFPQTSHMECLAVLQREK